MERIREALRIESFTDGYLRALSLVLLAFALDYWAGLIGVIGEGNERFDLVDEHWRAASAVLAIGLPVAALGLWNAAHWGIVLWLIAVAIELVMHLWLTDLFGRADWRVGFHAFTVFVYALNQGLEWWMLRRRTNKA